jgi:hypothetical protein
MNTAIEIAIALFVAFAVFAALRGNWAGAFAALVGALVLGVLAIMVGPSAIAGGRDRAESGLIGASERIRRPSRLEGR